MRLTKHSVIPWGCVFKITFPNGKIYVGSDTALTAKMDYFKYFGSPQKAKPEMLADLGDFLANDKAYTLKKELLYSSENVAIGEILKIEHGFIKSLDAKNPSIGYNR
jgi:hypothetical protein